MQILGTEIFFYGRRQPEAQNFFYASEQMSEYIRHIPGCPALLSKKST